MEHMRRKTAMHNERTQHIVAIYGVHSLAKSSEIEEKQKLEKAEKYRAHERDNRKDFFHRLGKKTEKGRHGTSREFVEKHSLLLLISDSATNTVILVSSPFSAERMGLDEILVSEHITR